MKLDEVLAPGKALNMQKLGWYLVAFCMLAGACEKSEASDATVSMAGHAGTMASAGSPPGLELDVGGTGSGAASSGGRPAVDLSSVQMPVVRCAPLAAGGAAADSAAGAAGSAESDVASAGGAAWDEACAPPPSTCLGNLPLVYFDEGECLEGFCDWQKKSLDCNNSCLAGGCQDSITTK